MKIIEIYVKLIENMYENISIEGKNYSLFFNLSSEWPFKMPQINFEKSFGKNTLNDDNFKKLKKDFDQKFLIKWVVKTTIYDFIIWFYNHPDF